MKRFALCLMVLFGWIITYYHPKPDNAGWAVEVYKTEYEPIIMLRRTVPTNVWEVKLNDKTKLYLPVGAVAIQEVNEEKPKEEK